MASPTREAVYTALMAQIQATLGSSITTYSRRLSLPNKFAQEIGPLPGLMLMEHTEKTTKAGPGATAKRQWFCAAIVVFQQTEQPGPHNPGAAPAGVTIINPIVDALEAVFDTARRLGGTNTVTLGNQVTDVYIEGTTTIESGDTDTSVEAGTGGYGGALVPLTILVP